MKGAIKKGLFCAMLPPAVIYTLAAHVAGVAWDGYWELVHFVRTGGRG